MRGGVGEDYAEFLVNFLGLSDMVSPDVMLYMIAVLINIVFIGVLTACSLFLLNIAGQKFGKKVSIFISNFK
jgi:hypothetical protein